MQEFFDAVHVSTLDVSNCNVLNQFRDRESLSIAKNHQKPSKDFPKILDLLFIKLSKSHPPKASEDDVVYDDGWLIE